MENSSGKIYDLEERTFLFAKDCRTLVRTLVPSIGTREDGKQLVRSSGSVGANYIEANEHLGENDLRMRVKICRKEAKESGYWLRLIFIENDQLLEMKRQKLLQEATELTRIFGSILQKLETRKG